jgi:ABC-2 type transport system permease protein
MKSLNRTLAIMFKEVRQLSRDKLTFGMIVGIPVIQMVMFGYAINTDVRDLRAGVVDLANTSASRALIADVEASQVAAIIQSWSDVVALERAIRNGDVKLGIYIPRDFEQRLGEGRSAAAQLLVDGSDPTIGSIANRLTEMPRIANAQQRSLERTPPIFAVRTYYNPERRSAVQIVPALIGVILTLTMVLFTAVAIVRERERGNFELLVTTPVKTVELMIGKIIPYIGIGIIQVTIVLIVGAALFAVPIRGALTDLYLAALAFVMASLGLGLTISTIARTQFQSMQLAIFVFLPSILLSGFMFPFDGMPQVARWIGSVLPLTHFIELIRGIVLRGATIGELDDHLLALAAFFVVTIVIAVLRFAKRLD